MTSTSEKQVGRSMARKEDERLVLGQALYENIVYDEYGQLLSGSLMDYALPTAEMTPQFVTTMIETPPPTNPLVVALRPFGVSDIDMVLTPARVWREIQDARNANGDRR